MKKLLAIILSLVLITSLVSCVTISDDEIKEPSDVSVEGEDKESEDGDKVVVKDEKVTVDEAVLVDEAGIKITAKSLENDNFFGPELKLLIENNSGKDLTFQCRDASVNGCMVDTTMSVEVVNGKKANDGISFMQSDLESYKIDKIADMEFSFYIYDSDWETYLDTDVIRIETSVADTYEYKYDDSGDIAYSGNGIKIIIKGLSEDDSIFGPSVVVYIENTSDKNVTVQARDVSINGFMVNAMFSCEITAGKRAIDTITFMSNELEDNGITSIEDVELSFHVFDSDDWDGIVDTELVKITF